MVESHAPNGAAIDARQEGGRARRVAAASLAVTGVLLVAKLAVWATTGSLAVLSQALDSGVDIVALGLMYVGVRIAHKPADASHHYGHAKAENLVAFTQTLILVAVAVVVASNAAWELTGAPVEVRTPWYALALLAGSVIVDAARAWYLTAAARAERSEALAAGALNILTDVSTAVVALASLAFVRSGLKQADPLGAIFVSLAVVAAAARLGKRSIDVLMDRVPLVTVEAIAAAAAGAQGVAEARRVRVRGTSEHLFTDVTVAAGRTASLERTHDIAERVEQAIEEVSPGSDVVVHVEPTSASGDLIERVLAAASRSDDVYEVHNVLVHEIDGGGKGVKRVALHAKVNPRLSLDEAHELSEHIEASVFAELERAGIGAEGVRIDTHMEPLETATPGRDVTEDRDDIVVAVRDLTVEEPDVIDCHEVVVTEVDGRLSLVVHVSGRPELPLGEIHEATERIEDRIHALLPEVGPVLIHFEPT